MSIRDRRFPMLDGPSVDWETAEEIHKMYEAPYPNGQTVERIAERGGFSYNEVTDMLKLLRERRREQRRRSKT